MPYDQSTSPVQITTPFGANVLLLRRIHGVERISELFHFNLELFSENDSLDFSQIVGQNVTLTFSLPAGGPQYLNGVVGRFTQAGRTPRATTYFAEVHPWLWMLGMSTDCRIFQNQTAPDIIKKVFSDLGFSAYKDSLTATYTARDYCVQYNETALAFVCRLMEEEGIFYFFEHSDSAHTLVLADDTGAYGSCPGLSQATMAPASPGGREIDNAVLECRKEQQVVVGKSQLDDYNFQIPSTDLLATAGDTSARTWYNYPGRYQAKSDGETRAGLRLTAMEALGVKIAGRSTCRAFHSGCQFELAGHYRSDMNASYALTSVSHQFDEEAGYSNVFEAIPVSQAFHPPVITPRPIVAGCQTATVVGKSGEEIWTDSYGRIKVQFHWDQLGTNDENSSCWIRVAQGWAGKQWGAIFLPRIGQEVVVTFEEGDPDRPLVTGSVYNAEQTVPYALPDNQTRSTVKSHSSPNQDGFNEIRFEDKAGSEEFFMQAQKDMNVTVLNDQTVTVSQNRTVTVSEKDEKLVVDKGNRTVAVNTGNETHTVKGTRDITVEGNVTHTDKADFTRNVTGNYTLKVSGNLSIEVSGSVSIKAGTSFANEAGTSLENKSGTSLTNQAGTSLTNQSGTSLTNDAGTSMTNQANVSIDSKANAQHTVESSGMMVVKGSLVQIN